MGDNLRIEETFGGLRLNERSLTLIKKKFPPIHIGPETQPPAMYVSGGEQRVLQYLEDIVAGRARL